MQLTTWEGLTLSYNNLATWSNCGRIMLPTYHTLCLMLSCWKFTCLSTLVQGTYLQSSESKKKILSLYNEKGYRYSELADRELFHAQSSVEQYLNNMALGLGLSPPEIS